MEIRRLTCRHDENVFVLNDWSGRYIVEYDDGTSKTVDKDSFKEMWIKLMGEDFRHA